MQHVKQDVQIHVKLDTYVKLSELKARFRKKSFDEVIKELVKVFEASGANVAGTTSDASTTSASVVAETTTTTSDASKVSDADLHNQQNEDLSSLSERIADLLEKKLFRKFQDELNAYTGKVEQVLQKQAEIIEKFEALEERVKKLEGDVIQKKNVRRGKPDKCEILRKELIVFESDVARKGSVTNRDAFFRSLERDCGAEILEVKGQRVAVDPNFWSEFKEKLNTLDTNDESKLKKVLGKEGYELLKTLWEGGLVYYDSVNKRWVLSEPESEGEEELEDIDYV